MRVGNAVRVLSRAVTSEFRPNLRAATLGMFQRFENHHCGSFADHKTIAIAIERSHGVGGVVVAH